MDIEHSLVSRCIQTGAIETLVSRGIAPKHFEDDQHRAVYQTVVSHMSRYNYPPSRDAVMSAHPNYRLLVSEDAIDFLIDQMVKKVKRRETQKALIQIARVVDDPDQQQDLEMVMLEHAEHIAQVVPTSKLSRLSEVPTRIELYRRLQREGRIPGIATGWPTIDRIILGVQPHEFFVVSAPSSVGKSLVLAHIALSAYLADPSARPLFISLEMEADALLRRWDAMAAQIELSALKAIKLGQGDINKWEQWGERASKAPNDIFVVADVHTASVQRVLADTMRYKPSATFTDYIQLMDGPGNSSYQKVGDIAKGLKRIARMTGVPQFTASQTNRSGFKEGTTMENVADSIEIPRSADIFMGLDQDEDHKLERRMLVKLIKNRDGKKDQCEINWDFETMDFSEVGKFEERFKPRVLDAVADNPFAAVVDGQPSNSNPFLVDQ